MKPSRLALLVSFAMLWSACSHWSTSSHRCNPLGGGVGEDCLLPFPSSFYTRKDVSTPTGLRLDLEEDTLPISRFGARLDPTPYNRRDGFSAVGSLLAHFPTPIDSTGLPTPERAESATTADSPVQLIRFDDGMRVPLFAELDANADPDSDSQGLVIQPLMRLRPKTRYIALVQNLRGRDGHYIAPLSGFRQLRDETIAPGSAAENERERYKEIFARIAKAGVARDKLQLAWDFTTGSDERTVGRLVKMRDAADGLSRRELSADERPEDREPIRVREIEDNPRRYRNLLRRVQGTFLAPSFLQGGNGNRLNLGQDGEPIFDRYTRFPLVIHVPDCARTAKGPLPVLIYGHGTFNSAEREMSTPYAREVLNRLCMIEVGTDWLGRSRDDLTYFLFRVIPNWNNFAQVTDNLQQAHINIATLAKLVRHGALDSLAELQWHGKSLVDSHRVSYLGISEGGCQGVTALALSPDIERGALNVPCGFWSMFFWRSSDFHHVQRAMKFSYPGALERQKLMTLSQLLWDYTDPANYGEHLLRDPLPGNQTKKILYQEGINDASVPNLTTRAMARTIGLKLLKPRIEAVPGIEESTGPLDSAYVQYDIGVRPRLGADNVPPPVSLVHERIRELDAVQEQIENFLREGGRVQDSCNGEPCVFPGG